MGRKKKRLRSNVSGVRTSKEEQWFGKPSSMFYDRSAVESLELKKHYAGHKGKINKIQDNLFLTKGGVDELGTVYLSKKKCKGVTPTQQLKRHRELKSHG